MSSVDTTPGRKLLPSSRRRRSWLRTVAANPQGAFAIIVLTAFVILALAGPAIAPHDPDALIGLPFEPPSRDYLFGTDDLGRDQLSRIIDSLRIALFVGIGSVSVGATVGIAIGIVAAYRAGVTESFLMRVVDVKFAFPDLVLALIVVAALGASLASATLAISIIFMPRFARLSRTATRGIVGRAYVQSARLSGVSAPRIMVRHVLPNILSSIIVLAALSFATAELAYATLSFLGLGAQPPQSDLGLMLATARSYMTIDPWLVVFPGMTLVLITISASLFGDSLRDALDPKSQTGVLGDRREALDSKSQSSVAGQGELT